MTAFPEGFLWGAATAAHQVEGGNWNNDWWAWEQDPASPCVDVSGDACDHYHRYPDDIATLAGVGLNTYRFSLEWSRIEPEEGQFSNAALDHYLRMCDTCHANGVTPVVTYHHFTLPRWVADRGGWIDDGTPDLFARFCERASGRLGDAIGMACTINEPAVVAALGYHDGKFPPGENNEKLRDVATEQLIRAHHLGRQAIKAGPGNAPVGITLAMREWDVRPGGEAHVDRLRGPSEDVYLAAAAEDDFIGVQAYFRAIVGPDGSEPAPAESEMTLYGWEFRPQAIAGALRRAWTATGGKVPLVVTENGVAMADDQRRVAFLRGALEGVLGCLEDGIDVRGYIYWTLIDNFEWAAGYAPQFGLLSCDRETFERGVRPSARWLGAVARANALLSDSELELVAP